MSSPAFVSPALPTRPGRTAVRVSVPRCNATADEYFPRPVRNAAPHISFNGTSGIFMAMSRVKAFTEDDEEPPLFDYGDRDWTAEKPAVKGPVCWPAGDGRDVLMTGTRGSYNVGNDMEYQEAPPGGFFKRSCDS